MAEKLGKNMFSSLKYKLWHTTFLRQSLKNCLTSPSCFSQIHCHVSHRFSSKWVSFLKVYFYSAFDCHALICCFLACFKHIYDTKIAELSSFVRRFDGVVCSIKLSLNKFSKTRCKRWKRMKVFIHFRSFLSPHRRISHNEEWKAV